MDVTYPTFSDDCHSLVKKYLTPHIFDRLKDLKTSSGFTLDQAIRSGVVNQDSHIGIYAGDAESYRLFSPIFDPIIADYHGVTAGERPRKHIEPVTSELPNLDEKGDFVLSTRIRVARNLSDMPLGPALSDRERHLVAARIIRALMSLEGDLSGVYYSIDNMAESDKSRLIEDHFLFKEGDRFLDAAGLNRNWPHDRGIFHNRDKSFLVWVNEEDQLRIISMEKGGDVSSVWLRLQRAIQALNRDLEFLSDERLGYLTSCPTNLGTAMRASVHIRLPRLAKQPHRLKELADNHHLQLRGVDGEHSDSRDGIFDISNRRRLGVSQQECLHDLCAGIECLIEKEKQLQ